jgi:hypothetical protein
MKVCIVAVHGVIPHPRYAFQDEVAKSLADQLNARNTGWTMDIAYPETRPSQDPASDETPSIVRVHRARLPTDAEEPITFDVTEAYWSPIDKGHTSAISVLSWLLRAVFTPLNTTARYLETPWKAAFDISVVVAVLVIIAAFAIASISFAGFAYQAIVNNLHQPASEGSTLLTWLGGLLTGLIQALFSPFLALIGALPTQAIGLLILGVAGVYLLYQAVTAHISVSLQREKLMKDPIQFRSRIYVIVALYALGVAAIALSAFTPVKGHPMLLPAAFFVLVVFFFESARRLFLWFLPSFFGDVQIYCTRDENSDFFVLHELILQKVMRTIVSAIQATPPYDRVYILAHSLGSTIALDAIIHLHNLVLQGALSPGELKRIRGFVTFGTSLEKTKYFFDVYNPSFSQQFEEWRDDRYGMLFTPRADSLALSNSQHDGIYWANNWYFFDFIADQICSYRSFMLPGEKPTDASDVRRQLRTDKDALKKALNQDLLYPRLVAENACSWQRPKVFDPILHGKYLEDPWFWHNDSTKVLDMLLTRDSAGPSVRAARGPESRLHEPMPPGEHIEDQTRDVI